MKDSFEIQLLNDLKNSKLSAFESLFNTYYDKLFNYSIIFTKEKFVSEEIVLDIFTEFWQKKIFLNIKSNLFAYLLKSVKNRSLSYLKKVKIDFYNEEENEIEEEYNNPEKKFLFEEEFKKVENILELIPPRSREVFVLHKFDGLKYAEIADLLGISKNTVENHIVKALRILRNYYKQDS